MKLIITCPGCQKRFTSENDLCIGKRATCKNCQVAFIIDPGNYRAVQSMAEDLLDAAKSAEVDQPASIKNEAPTIVDEQVIKATVNNELPAEPTVKTTFSPIRGLLVTIIIGFAAIGVLMQCVFLDNPPFLCWAFSICFGCCIVSGFFVAKILPAWSSVTWVVFVLLPFYLTLLAIGSSKREVFWQDKSGTHYRDTYMRNNIKIIHRYSWCYDPNYSIAGSYSDSEKPHGPWEITTYDPFSSKTEWYWYGEKITEGEWHLRNK